MIPCAISMKVHQRDISSSKGRRFRRNAEKSRVFPWRALKGGLLSEAERRASLAKYASFVWRRARPTASKPMLSVVLRNDYLSRMPRLPIDTTWRDTRKHVSVLWRVAVRARRRATGKTEKPVCHSVRCFKVNRVILLLYARYLFPSGRLHYNRKPVQR